VHQAYRVSSHQPVCFFRDDGLSDLIGFTYSDWHADDAVANLLNHLTNIAKACHDVPGAVVSIIMDGENAWEYYPENGYYFLEALYKGLAEHPKLELTTFSEAVKSPLQTQNLSRLVAGSWVYGTFSTWIGEQDKNRAWDMLVDAKHCFDRAMATGRLSDAQRQAAQRQLGICEGSDWFWWFGDYNPAEAVSDFERLFRRQLTALYQLLGEEPPEYLSRVFARGGGVPQLGGVMRRGSGS
jgi:alpha-amylase/alpha-mannosidase (GH57 family)